MKEYIYYKYLISSNNLKEDSKENLTFDQEIFYYKKSNKIKNVLGKKRMIKRVDESENKTLKKRN